MPARTEAALRPAVPRPFGEHLRHWRQHRRLSQLDLAAEAAVSTRHISFVETGRATPSREMVLRLAARLDIPLRERNALLVAAGFAPMYRESALGDPAMHSARAAVQRILDGHLPYPALAFDRHWNLVMANASVGALLQLVADPALAANPVNLMRLSLHPDGLAPHIGNFAQWRAHLLHRLQNQFAATGDPVLHGLLEEIGSYPVPPNSAQPHLGGELVGVVLPFELRTPAGMLRFISTTTVFGSPVDITLQELALETFFPADAETAALLAALHAGAPAG